MASPIRIGTRGSALAMVQARLVQEALATAGQASTLVVIETGGDRRAPDTAWGEGAFVSAIEQALLDRRADLAVHSAKDIPTDEDPRLRIAAYLPRADPRDALVLRLGAIEQTIDELPGGARVGTDSPRRTGFVRARRPDLALHPLHGNVDTRLRRLDAGETDALILACAGLDRLGLATRIVARLDPQIVPPAPGQGAIALQVRADDEPLVAGCASIDDRSTRIAVETERAFLQASGGGCRAPIGALATVDGEVVTLLGGRADPDGADASTAFRIGSVGTAREVSQELADELGLERRRVLVTRDRSQAHELMDALRARGIDPVAVPAIAIDFATTAPAADRAAGLLHTVSWVVVTSSNGARAVLGAATRVLAELGVPRWAAIGDATRDVLEGDGIDVAFVPRRSSSQALAADLPVDPGDHVLVLRGDLADGSLAIALGRRGAEVEDVIAYRTIEAPDDSRRLLRDALEAGPIDALVLTSGSTARGLAALARAIGRDLRDVAAICIGDATAAVASSQGFDVVATAPIADADALAAATARVLADQVASPTTELQEIR
jgi:hydroxymethylbilane synthase